MADTVKMKLIKPHTRGRLALPTGSEIQVPRSKRDWYLRTGTAIEVTGAVREVDNVDRKTALFKPRIRLRDGCT